MKINKSLFWTIGIAWIVLLFSPIAFADVRTWNPNFCAFNGSNWNVTDLPAPTVYSDDGCAYNFAHSGRAISNSSTVGSLFPTGSGESGYCIVNISIKEAGSSDRVWGFANGSSALVPASGNGEPNARYDNSCPNTGSSGMCFQYDSQAAYEFMWLPKPTEAIFFLYNFTWNNSNFSIYNIPYQAGQIYHLNGSMQLAGKTNTIENVYFGQPDDGNTVPVINVSRFECWNVTTTAALADIITPIINVTFNISQAEIKINNILNISTNITDETGLLSANITINSSFGTIYANYTISGTRQELSNVTMINDSRGTVLNITFYATDTNNNVAQNSTIVIIKDTIGTFTTGLNLSTIRINNVINFSVNITDDDKDINITRISHNQTGITTNFTFEIGKNKFHANSSQAITITLARGGVINLTSYYNDTSGNISQSASTILTVADTAITFDNFINASDKTYNRNQTINWSCTDPDSISDITTINVTFERSNPPKAELVTNGTDFNITTNMTTEGTYFLNATCISNSVQAFSTIFNITLDVSTPTLSGVPANGSFYRINTNVTVTGNDNIALFEMNTTTYDIGTSVIRNSSNITNISATERTINATILTEWGDAQYNLTVWAGDTKNKKRAMPQYKVGKSTDNRTLQFNNTNTGLECNISYGTTNPSENKFLPVQANVSLKMNVTYKDDDYYKIVYDIVAPNTGFISATKFVCNQKITQIYDNLAGHLLIGTGQDRLSYDAQDLVDSGFTITTKLDTDDNTFFQTIKKSGIVEGAVVSYDPRADNLNIIEVSRIIEIDTGIPQFNSLNLSKDGLLPNNTYIFANVINVTFNVSDKNNATDGILVYINDVKNITLGYRNNESVNATVFLDDGIYQFRIEINDSAGNKINSSFINFTVDTTHQNVTNITPLNYTFINNLTVNFTANITEVNPDIAELWTNTTGIWHRNMSTIYQNNVTFNFTTILPQGHFIWNVCANDSTGSKRCFAENYTIIADNTKPTITLNTPLNNTAFSEIEKPNINFRISADEIVKNCSLFLGNSLSANESTEKKSHNFTVSRVEFGAYAWNATCYDLANNLGASSAFNFEIKFVSGTGGSTEQPASGGILSFSNITKQPSLNTEYSLTYICQKVSKFLNETPNYKLPNIVLLQEDIRWEINMIIPFTELKNYIDNYNQFCGKEQKPFLAVVSQNNTNILDRVAKITGFDGRNGLDYNSYIKFPLMLNFGSIGNFEDNMRGIFDLTNILFPLSLSGDISENPNIFWDGKVRIIPLIFIFVITIVIILIKSKRILKSERIDSLLLSDAEQETEPNRYR